MKIPNKHIKYRDRAAILAIASLVLTAAASHAQTQISTNNGDLILGFRATSQAGVNNPTYSFEVDLGQFSTINNAAIANGGTISLNTGGTLYGSNGGLAQADLTTVYGSAWSQAGSTVAYSVAANYGAASDGYSTFSTAGNGTTNQFHGSGFSGRISGEIGGITGSYNTIGGLSSGTVFASPNAVALSNASPGSYKSAEGGANPYYGAFTINPELSVLSSNQLKLDYYNSTASTVTTAGYFSLDSEGDLSFITASPVPEPASATMIGLFGIVCTSLRRRRRDATA
jgi:hypothetical protein